MTKEEYDQNPKHCIQCGKVIEFWQRCNKFCSSSCAAIYNNKFYVKRKPEGKCEFCGKLINTRKGRFCSDKCKQEYENRMKSLQCIAMKVPDKYQKYYTDSKYGIKEYRYGYTALNNYLEEHKEEILKDRENRIGYKELSVKYDCDPNNIRNAVLRWEGKR